MKNKHGIRQLSDTYQPKVSDNPIQQFTATVHRNFRDTNTINPKVLLNDVYSDGVLIRDHMWVNQAELETYIPKSTKVTNSISFSGNLMPYQTRADEKQTIVNIHNIQLA